MPKTGFANHEGTISFSFRIRTDGWRGQAYVLCMWSGQRKDIVAPIPRVLARNAKIIGRRAGVG